VPTGDGYRAGEPAGERVAAFCDLAHVVPWASQGAHWQPGALAGDMALDDPSTACSHCGEAVGDAYVLGVERRGEVRVVDAFCSPAHLSAWARTGGRQR
jgi:hypothetical protein